LRGYFFAHLKVEVTARYKLLFPRYQPLNETIMFEYKGKQIETDSQGYLLNHTDWDEEMIAVLAKDEGIDVTEAHLEVVLFVRKFYEEFNTSPAVRMLVKAMEKAHGPEKGNSKYLFKLFKQGPAKQATKLAGLPKPAKCL
jgi:tRNA 2-thiouridine synthesizing protein E